MTEYSSDKDLFRQVASIRELEVVNEQSWNSVFNDTTCQNLIAKLIKSGFCEKKGLIAIRYQIEELLSIIHI